MRFAAFFRNLNLGRPRCPSRTQFEAAFIAAGAGSAASFLTNGTLVFEADSPGAARRILAAARADMAGACGLGEPAFLRELEYLRTLVATDPFGGIDRRETHDYCVTFLPDAMAIPDDLPPASPRGDVEIVRMSGREALCIALARKGSPNLFLERRLAVPTTTRVWNTVVRLVAKHA